MFDMTKIAEKFRYDPNSVKKEKRDVTNDIYLAKVSYRYAYFKRILCILLILVLAAFVFSGNLSYDKFYYLTKDIDLANDYVNSVYDTITYNSGNSQSFVTYRGGIAVASRERFSIFSAGGRELFSSDHSYGNPMLVSSDKYVLLYDVGGKQYSLYNSFSELKDAVLEYPIYGAAASKDGDFALITRSEKYSSSVRVLLANGKEYEYNFSSGRAVGVALSDNGSKMAVALTFSDAGEIRTEIRAYRVGSEDYKNANVTFTGIPYSVNIFTNGNICAVGADGVNVYSAGLDILEEYFADGEIYICTFGEDNVAFAYLSKGTAKTEAVLLDKRGNTVRKSIFDERILDIAVCDGYLFVQKLDSFERINIALNTSVSEELIATGFKMIPVDKDTLLIFGSSYAKFLDFSQ